MCDSWVVATPLILEASCADQLMGTALAGKTATAPAYEPGACEPIGGEPTGSVMLAGPSTFCCL